MSRSWRFPRTACFRVGFRWTFGFVVGLCVLGCAGSSGSQDSVSLGPGAVTAEAMYYPDYSGQPVIRISLNFPNRPGVYPAQYLVFRSDQGWNRPALMAEGVSSRVFDDGTKKSFKYEEAPPQGTEGCPTATTEYVNSSGIQLGVPYQYRAQQIVETTSTSQPCFYGSSVVATAGSATALGQPILVSPNEDQALTGYVPFDFSSVATSKGSVTIGYVLQISSGPEFLAGPTYTSAEVQSSDVSDQTITIHQRFEYDTFQRFLADTFGKSVSSFWWRIGARNVADVPGPAPDPSTGLRYLFGAPHTFTIAGGAPPRSRYWKAKLVK